ncbi:MAG: ORF6N domain-containing protein [Paludibacteraceae bacterium]|nr:ORF6N domain-containing protein [Paludibacteraceae bacterium]
MEKRPYIYTVRGKKVVTDRDLAAVLGVETRQLKRVAK